MILNSDRPSYLKLIRRRSRINQLLQPNLHFKICASCKNYVYRELYYIWFDISCCDLIENLPPALKRLVRQYKKVLPKIPSKVILTTFLIEKYNESRNLDISFIVYDMCKKSYIEKVKKIYFEESTYKNTNLKKV